MFKRSPMVILAYASLALLSATSASAADPAKRKPDLADAVAGIYAGEVISDSKGSSQSDVDLTVARTGPNTVQITSSYPRLPVVTVKLTKAMSQILQRDGDTVFLYDPTKTPAHLDVSFHQEVSWSGQRQ